MSGDIVGPLGRTARILAAAGIILIFQKRVGEGAVGLRQPDHVVAFLKAAAGGAKILLRPLDLHVAEGQGAKHADHGAGVMLLVGHHEGVVFVTGDHALADAIEIPQQLLAMHRGVVEDGFERDELVADNVAECPFPAGPGLGKVPTAFARVISAGVGIEGRKRHRHRSGIAHPGRFA